MRLVFLYGPAAAGKLTIGRLVAQRTGLPLFHNHLIVDAVGAVFPFGSEDFIRLRERFWLETIGAAARAGRSLIFTFAPEPTVDPKFPQRLVELVAAAGGETILVALSLSSDEQDRRISAPSRAEFGKLQSMELLRQLRDQFDACMTAMPEPALRIDTGATAPDDSAAMIARIISA
jgi:hypothetical protein